MLIKLSVTVPLLSDAARYFPETLDTSPSATAAVTAETVAQCLNDLVSAGNLTALPVPSPQRLLPDSAAGGVIVDTAHVSLRAGTSLAADRVAGPFEPSACPEVDAKSLSIAAVVEAAQFDMEQAVASAPNLTLTVGVRFSMIRRPMLCGCAGVHKMSYANRSFSDEVVLIMRRHARYGGSFFFLF